MSADLKFNIDFLGKRYIAFVLSTLMIVGSFYLWFAQGEGKYGTDFKGGHELLVKVEEGGSVEGLRDAFTKAGLHDARVQAFELGSKDFTVQLGSQAGGAADVKNKVAEVLKATFNDKASIVRADFVGPTVGEELKFQALMATIVSILAILVYVAFRFEFAFGLGAVAALFHDVIVATGIYLLAGHELNMSTLAAALTIVGYSVNDTIVIFDRAREEIFKRKDFNLEQLMNESINACLSRTIITHLLTIFSALALYIFGGGSISDLSLYLVAGIVSGTYSTIYIASPVVIWWQGIRERRIAATHAKAA